MAAPRARLFFALWPDAATRAGLVRWQQTLLPLCGGRAMHAEDVHLTLAFLGDMPLDDLPGVAVVADRVHAEGFELHLDHAGCWRHNRIVWGGTEVPPPRLEALAQRLRAQLTAAAIAFDGKPFVPHITLLRKAACNASMPVLPPIVWRVGSFVLVRSTGATAGPRYRVEHTWPLGACL